jgi:hypothetical protein
MFTAAITITVKIIIAIMIDCVAVEKAPDKGAPKPEQNKRPDVVAKIEDAFFEAKVLSIDESEIKILVLSEEHTSSRSGVKWAVGHETPRTLPLINRTIKSQTEKVLFASRYDHRPSWMYDISDVRACDIVRLYVTRANNENYRVRNISIIRRPGASVPQSPGDVQTMGYSHHKRMKYYQDFEDRGTPIPEKWGGKRQEDELTVRLKHVNSILATAEKIEKEKKAKELKADPKAEKK